MPKQLRRIRVQRDSPKIASDSVDYSGIASGVGKVSGSLFNMYAKQKAKAAKEAEKAKREKLLADRYKANEFSKVYRRQAEDVIRGFTPDQFKDPNEARNAIRSVISNARDLNGNPLSSEVREIIGNNVFNNLDVSKLRRDKAQQTLQSATQNGGEVPVQSIVSQYGVEKDYSPEQLQEFESERKARNVMAGVLADQAEGKLNRKKIAAYAKDIRKLDVLPKHKKMIYDDINRLRSVQLGNIVKENSILNFQETRAHEAEYNKGRTTVIARSSSEERKATDKFFKEEVLGKLGITKNIEQIRNSIDSADLIPLSKVYLKSKVDVEVQKLEKGWYSSTLPFVYDQVPVSAKSTNIRMYNKAAGLYRKKDGTIDDIAVNKFMENLVLGDASPQEIESIGSHFNLSTQDVDDILYYYHIGGLIPDDLFKRIRGKMEYSPNAKARYIRKMNKIISKGREDAANK